MGPQTFTPEQIQAFFSVLGGLAIAHAGSLITQVWQYFRRIRKMRRDITAAHNLIRTLTIRVSKLEKNPGEENEILRSSLSE